MAKEAVARVRDGRAHQFLEIRSTIVLDREALLDIEPVLVGIVLSRIAALFVEPALDPSADSIQRQFGELLFETRVVGEKDASLPFPDAHLRRRDTRACRGACS